MPAVKLKSLFIWLTLLAGGTAWAACPMLLDVRGADGKQALMLDRCEAQMEVQSAGGRGQVLFRLKEPDAQRWREALKPESTLWSAMLLAQASVRGVGASVPPGVLLESHTARLMPDPMWLWNARAATLLLVMRGTAAAPSTPTPPVDCTPFHSDRLIFWFREMEVQPGGIVVAQPMLVKGPGDFQPVPGACITGWRLSSGAPAVIDATSDLTAVAVGAKDGTAFTLMAQIGLQQIVQGQLRIIDPEAHPLSGRWSQIQETACGSGTQRVPPRPLRELVFGSNGSFSATWTPLERYFDYAGTYTFDVNGAQLQLAVTEGNDMPAQKQIHARARFDARGRLVVSALPGGSRNPTDASVCEMVFGKN